MVEHIRRKRSGGPGQARVPSRCVYLRTSGSPSSSSRGSKASVHAEHQQPQHPQPASAAPPSTPREAPPTTISSFIMRNAVDTVLADAKIYRHLSSVSPSSDNDHHANKDISRINSQSNLFLDSPVSIASPAPSDSAAAAVSSQSDTFETVFLAYPNSDRMETFPLCVPCKKDEYNPIQDIKSSVLVMVKLCLSNEEAGQFGDEVSGPLRAVLRSCNRKDAPGLKDALLHFNTLMQKVRQERVKTGFALLKPPTPVDVIYHILDQAYAHTVSPHVDLLKSYKTFSNNVYGEVKHSLVSELLQRVQLGANDTFLDMGSGTGNVALQVAAQTQCTSYGIEVMPNPSRLARDQANEFQARCAAYGVPCGPIHVWQGDFTEDEMCHGVLQRADVVFVNNYAFDAKLNLRILERFLDLKDGCVVISLKLFGSGLGNENALENMFRVKEYYFGENRVSWMAEGGKYYVHTLKR
ncbi:Nucleosomal histone H3-Lys79 methylase [Chytriomyces hyalinus]|nr:Nucleosomal histone H3-Lys79 methylase [Chytriomyces hyalinus]